MLPTRFDATSVRGSTLVPGRLIVVVPSEVIPREPDRHRAHLLECEVRALTLLDRIGPKQLDERPRIGLRGHPGERDSEDEHSPPP
jgi:hypothetical protein